MFSACVCVYLYIYIYILYYIYSVFDMPSIHVCSKWFLLQSCLDINVLYIASDRHCLKLCFHISNQPKDNTRQGHCSRFGSSLLIAELLALSKLVAFLLAARSTVWNHRNVQRDQHHQHPSTMSCVFSIRPHFYLDEVNARNRWKQL